MNEFYALWASGRVIDGIILLIILEVISLFVFMRGNATKFLWALLPGLCLLMALRLAITGASTSSVLIWLTLALPFHLADVWFRYKKK